MLLARVLTALVGIPAAVLVIYQGNLVFLLAVISLNIMGLLEFKNIMVKSGSKAFTHLLWLGGILFPVFFYGRNEVIFPFLILYFLLNAVYFLAGYPNLSPRDLSFNLLGVFYVSLGFSHLLLLRNLKGGFWLVLYVFVVVWATDTGAYFGGLKFGRHKLAPAVSPNKTWEGFVGGLLVSLMAAGVLLTYTDIPYSRTLIWLTPLVSIAGQVGDLFESSLKRSGEIKDSGNVLPGHGGILDRFDSTLWAAPFAYYLIVLLERLI